MRSRHLVDIFVCGTQKGGTTSLYAHFLEHPELSDPDRKELHFFDNETIDWAAPDYGGLHASFRDNDASKLRYDITPIYMFWQPSLGRIARYNPNAKLIFLIRDPFERAWSHWCMEWERGLDNLPFHEAIRSGRNRLDNLRRTADEWRVFSYLERGLYGEQIERALSLFPRDNLLFLRCDDLRNNHMSALGQISKLAGIGTFPDNGPKREHQRAAVQYPSIPTSEDRQLVYEFVHEDYQRFVGLTGLDVISTTSC